MYNVADSDSNSSDEDNVVHHDDKKEIIGLSPAEGHTNKHQEEV